MRCGQVMLFACYLLMEKKSFLSSRAVRNGGVVGSADQDWVDTLRQFDEAVKTYINYKAILSAATGDQRLYTSSGHSELTGNMSKRSQQYRWLLSLM